MSPSSSDSARRAASPEPPAPIDRDADYPSPAYAWYTVGVLMVIYVMSFVDRQILSLLVGPIRRDLQINDTQMSLLMGFSFALFYTFFGLPLGRMADSRSRRGLIAAGVFFWSVMTAACGVARVYWQFLLFRLGVGVGEAALSPSAYSLITDSFPRRKLATAMSVYATGIYIGSGMAFLLGGVVVGVASGQESVLLPLVGAVRPWQLVFFVVGLPGILLSLLMLSVREPSRKGVTQPGTSVPVREVLAYIRRNFLTFTCHNLGFALLSFSGYGAAAWIPTFLVRRYGMAPRDAGIWFGIIVMVAGTLGILFGGRLADRLAVRHRDGMLRIGLIASLCWAPFGITFVLMPSAAWSLAVMAPATFAGAMTGGAAPAAIQQIMPNEMRGQASALYLFVVNLIGLGLGPTAVALCTDYLFRDDAAVGWSLLLIGLVAHLGSLLSLWIGLRPFRESRDRLERYQAASPST